MTPLTGYCDRWSVKPGGTIRFMVSSAGNLPVQLRFVRHICADPNPDGPGYQEIPMASLIDGTHAGQAQQAFTGSYGHVPSLPIAPDLFDKGGLTLTATVWPTTPEKGRQGIIAMVAGDWRLALGIGPSGGAMLEARTPHGSVLMMEADHPMLARRWYDLTATLDPAGNLRLTQRPHAPFGDAGSASLSGAARPAVHAAEIFFAAMPGTGGAPTTEHFNGKLEHPAIAGLAAWDFSVGIPTDIASDTGPHAAHARLHRLPTRAMTGSNWTGAVHDWKTDPGQYAAIHFHDDDQGDLGWQESFALEVPADWPSGFYAAHISSDAGQDFLPFFVRPVRATADVAFLVPTFSYQVYGCHVRPGRGAEIAERAGSWGALLQTPDMNPEFGLSTYNHHSDGSGVSVVSRLRPMLDTRPKQMVLMDPVPGGSGTARINADSYFIHWLTRIGQAHDVITDHDLHEDGVELLSQYRVVIAGQHPEYHSERMMHAFEHFLGHGGRLMYLGGNGFYWRAEPSESSPHALEVRRAEGGIRVWETMPGESYHAFGGGYGGLWRRIGRSSHKLVGISFSTQGRHLGFPYHFTDGIADPRVAFMTEGIATAPGTAFGDRGYMGGGAAGFELDSVNPKYGTPPNALVVAKGIVIHEDYGWVNEDMLTHRHPLPQADWSCADMTFFETPSGGAVFSVGSMTYAGSIPVDNCENTLARLTTNVLRRFLDPAPFPLPPA